MKKIIVILSLAVILIALGVYSLRPIDLIRAHYIGDLVTKVLPDGRNLELVEPYSYVDSNGRQWGVPAGTIVDGASIPLPFWSIIGGPFSGKYRDASVIHDYYCDTKHRDWRDVHSVFHEAMRKSRVSETTAMLMYYAVYRFGPRWEVNKYQPSCPPRILCSMTRGVGLEFVEESLSYIQADMEEFQRFADRGSPSMEDTQAFVKGQIERLGTSPDKSTKTHKEFYPDFRDFPDDYDSLLSDEELQSAREERDGN